MFLITNLFLKLIYANEIVNRLKETLGFMIGSDGQIGTQSIKAINAEINEDVTNGLLIFGLVGGKASRIRFPILTDISRFEKGLIDLSKICQGINIKY